MAVWDTYVHERHHVCRVLKSQMFKKQKGAWRYMKPKYLPKQNNNKTNKQNLISSGQLMQGEEI